MTLESRSRCFFVYKTTHELCSPTGRAPPVGIQAVLLLWKITCITCPGYLDGTITSLIMKTMAHLRLCAMRPQVKHTLEWMPVICMFQAHSRLDESGSYVRITCSTPLIP